MGAGLEEKTANGVLAHTRETCVFVCVCVCVCVCVWMGSVPVSKVLLAPAPGHF